MKYFVRLVRPRFETQLTVVEADDEEDAHVQAMAQSFSRERDWRLVEFSFTDYRCHVEECVSEEDIKLDETTKKEVRARLSSTASPDENKYLLMQANVGTGHGEIVLQPWFVQEDNLMAHDLCLDWASEIELLPAGEPLEDIELEGTPGATNRMLAAALSKRPKPSKGR